MVERLYKKGLIVGIIVLFFGVSVQSVFANDITISMLDDTIPPVSTHSLDPPEPDGENGWYVSDVTVTLIATDDISGVEEIIYRVNGGTTQTIVGDNGTFLITQADDGDDVLVEYWAYDNAGNEESPHNEFTIDMDQTKPKIDTITEVDDGNPIQGWLMRFTATCEDATSGMNRVEFYLNDKLQSTVYGYGPEYQWEYKYYGDMSIDIRGNAYDNAGNMASDIFPDPGNFNNHNTQLSKSTEDTFENEPDQHNVDYDYAIIGGYFQYREHKGIILWRDVTIGAGDFNLYLYIDLYKFPDTHVYDEDYLTHITVDYFIPLNWPFNTYLDCKGIAFGNIEWS